MILWACEQIGTLVMQNEHPILKLVPRFDRDSDWDEIGLFGKL